MRFFEVDSAVDSIMGAAMVAQGRASQQGKVGKLSMNGFLQMLANSGIMMDYDGFKTVFDTNPALQNVIAKFDKDTITFAGDSDDEGEGYEEPETDIPDDERVSKMAKRAMKTREFVEAKEIGVYKIMGGVRYYVVKNKSGKEKLFSGPTPAAKKYAMTEATLTEFDRHQDIIDQIVDMQPETSNEIIRMAQKLGAPDKAIDDILQAVLDKVNIDEAELPPHLAKMFGKDGRQVDTRTDVMKQMRDIVANKQAMKVTFGDGKQMIDMYTASVLTQIYDKVNDNSKEAIIQRIGTIEKFNKLMPKLFGMLGEGHSPHKKGTEKYRKHMAAMHAGESVNEAWQAFKERSLTSVDEDYAKDMQTYKMLQRTKAQMSGEKQRGQYVHQSPQSAAAMDKEIGRITAKYPPQAIPKITGPTVKPKSVKQAAKMMPDESVEERSLTSAEKDKMKHYEKKLPKQDFIDRYGKEQGEAIYYATATKMAKKHA